MAVKTYRIQKLDQEFGRFGRDGLLNEIQLHSDSSKLKHSNIVEFYGHAKDHRFAYLFFELCDGTLEQYIEERGGKLSESEARKFGAQILEGLRALHGLGFSHRDLKANNVLMKDGVCKVSDLGLGTDKQRFNSSVGALGVRAPESILRDIRTLAVDIWSLGIMMHMMVFIEFPFANSGSGIEKAIVYDPYEIPEEPKIGPEFRDMLEKCLEKDPVRRITTVELCQHPCFTGVKN